MDSSKYDEHKCGEIATILHQFEDATEGEIDIYIMALGGSRGRGDYTPESDRDVFFVYTSNNVNVKVRSSIRFMSKEKNIDFQGFHLPVFLSKVSYFESNAWELLLNNQFITGSMLRREIIEGLAKDQSDGFFRLIRNFSQGLHGMYDCWDSYKNSSSPVTLCNRIKHILYYAELAEILFSYINTPVPQVIEDLLDNDREQHRTRLKNYDAYVRAIEYVKQAKDATLVDNNTDLCLGLLSKAMEEVRESITNVYRCAQGVCKDIQERDNARNAAMAIFYDPDVADHPKVQMYDDLESQYQRHLLLNAF